MKIDIQLIRNQEDFDKALARYIEILEAEPFTHEAKMNYDIIMSLEPTSELAVELEILAMQLNVAVIESLKFPIKETIHEILLIEHESSPLSRALSYRLSRVSFN
jgi:hypothetical protein